MHKAMSRKVLVQISLCGSLCRHFAILVRSLCVGSCAGSLCVILCDLRWPLGLWPRKFQNVGACLKVLVRILVHAFCVPCACLVGASVQVDGTWTTACLRPRAILLRSLCNFLVQDNFGSSCELPRNSAQGNWISFHSPCAFFFRFDFPLNTVYMFSKNYVFL